MEWQSRWRAIAVRAEGLARAANYLAQVFQISSEDTYSLGNSAIEELERIRAEVRSFANDHADAIPENAATAIKTFLDIGIQAAQSGAQANRLAYIAHLTVCCHQVDYFLRDAELEARNATDLAFEHLQRLIAVDEQLRERWQSAYAINETRCEALGSVHLLSHGIWAFKAAGGDSATDLVLVPRPIDRNSTLANAARALVLTEWKRVTDNNTPEAMSEWAIGQTLNYGKGILSPIELKRTRYIVLVTNKFIESPGDIFDHGYCFRHVVINVDPERPSDEGKTRRRERLKSEKGRILPPAEAP